MLEDPFADPFAIGQSPTTSPPPSPPPPLPSDMPPDDDAPPLPDDDTFPSERSTPQASPPKPARESPAAIQSTQPSTISQVLSKPSGVSLPLLEPGPAPHAGAGASSQHAASPVEAVQPNAHSDAAPHHSPAAQTHSLTQATTCAKAPEHSVEETAKSPPSVVSPTAHSPASSSPLPAPTSPAVVSYKVSKGVVASIGKIVARACGADRSPCDCPRCPIGTVLACRRLPNQCSVCGHADRARIAGTCGQGEITCLPFFSFFLELCCDVDLAEHAEQGSGRCCDKYQPYIVIVVGNATIRPRPSFHIVFYFFIWRHLAKPGLTVQSMFRRKPSITFADEAGTVRAR